MADYVRNGSDAETFLKQTSQLAGAWQGAADAWPNVGSRLQAFVVGASPSDTTGFDGLVNRLMDAWKGKAADEFKAKADAVKSFGIAVAGRASNAVTVAVEGSQLPSSMQYELMNAFDFTKTAQTISDMLAQTHNDYQPVPSYWESPAGQNVQTWAAHLSDVLSGLWNDNKPWTYVPTFEEFVNGSRAAFRKIVSSSNSMHVDSEGGQGSCSAILSLDQRSTWDGMMHYRSSLASFDYPVSFPAIDFQSNPWDDHRKSIMGLAHEGEYFGYLRKLVAELGTRYQTVTPPDPADESSLPKGGSGSTANNNNGNGSSGYGGSGGYDPGSYGSGGYDPSSAGTGGYDSTQPGTAGYDPNAYGTSPSGTAGYDPNAYGTSPSGTAGYDPNAYDPAGYGDGYDPYGGGSLAGAGLPGLGGSGTYTPGDSSGLGLGSGGGLGSAGGPGSGPDGLAGQGAGLSGASGRGGMPMAPGAGAGSGKDNKDRQRQSWLPEEDDVWGADTDASDGLL